MWSDTATGVLQQQCEKEWYEKEVEGINRSSSPQCKFTQEAAVQMIDGHFYRKHSWSARSSLTNNQKSGPNLLLQEGSGFPHCFFFLNLSGKAHSCNSPRSMWSNMNIWTGFTLWLVQRANPIVPHEYYSSLHIDLWMNQFI